MNNFCLKFRFSQAQHAMSDFVFFFKDRCFYASFFLICFYRSSPQFLLETKRFASIKNCSRFSALCDLPENFSLKIFRKVTNFILIFCFFLMFLVQKDGFFCCFQLKKNGFRDLCVSLRVFFWRFKVDEILTIISFYACLSVWFFLFGFIQKFATFFASVCEAWLRLCVLILSWSMTHPGKIWEKSSIQSSFCVDQLQTIPLQDLTYSTIYIAIRSLSWMIPELSQNARSFCYLNHSTCILCAILLVVFVVNVILLSVISDLAICIFTNYIGFSSEKN